jgi:hypothetical protein
MGEWGRCVLAANRRKRSKGSVDSDNATSETAASVSVTDLIWRRWPYLSDAMSITKRYFTSLLSMRS